MRVKLLRRLRKKIYDNLKIRRNNSKFTLNWAYLDIVFRGEYYKSERQWGTYNDNVFKVLLKELEHIVLKDYIINNALRRISLK